MAKTLREVIEWHLTIDDNAFEPLESGRVRAMKLTYFDNLGSSLNDEVEIVEAIVGVHDVAEVIIERAIGIEDYERCARLTRLCNYDKA